jgi:integral membrane sensor domain MASE1
VVTFIAVIIYIQAFLAGVAGVVLLAFRDRIVDIYAETAIDVSSSSLLGSAIGELILAGLLLLVASGLMRGSGGARLFVVIVEALRMGFALYTMIFHH